jgi:hypothetical protein
MCSNPFREIVMKIKSTRGILFGEGTDRKAYDITTECGEVYSAEPHGSQGYLCNGKPYKTLRELKQWIESEDSFMPQEEVVVNTPTTPTTLWDTVCPACLWLSDKDFAGDGGVHHDCTPFQLDMLDKYGLLLVNGEPDWDAAHKEVERAFKQFNLNSQS